jgi:hypothetical protein
LNRDYPPHCYYCDVAFVNADNYETHVVTKHAHMPAYPGIGDLDLYKLEKQDMYWEKPYPESCALEDLRNYVPLSERKKRHSKK